MITRAWAAMVLRHRTNDAAVKVVRTMTASRTPVTEHVLLPGSVMAWHEAPVYARTNGYVRKWYVDIGYKVKKGDLLAEIETPELDAQLRQAKADLNVVIAQGKLAQITAVRWKNLLKTDSVSQQETDEKVHQAEALSASVVAARANYQRLQDLVGFGKVIAPFDGVVSYRGTDIGALINNGSSPDVKPLFRIVQSDPLRLYVKIPETFANRITPKIKVRL
jgi:RND family efflux transporter MFP subunit